MSNKTLDRKEKVLLSLDQTLGALYKEYKDKKRDTEKRRNTVLHWLLSYYDGRFVKTIYPKPGYVEHTILPEGYTELEKYGLKDGRPDAAWDFYKYIAHTPRDSYCAICGTQDHLACNVHFGIAPRFEFCYKHADFVGVVGRLDVIDIKLRPKAIRKYEQDYKKKGNR